MKILFAVTYVNCTVTVVEYGSEDKDEVADKRYVAPNNKLAYVVDRVRTVRDGTIYSTNGKKIASLNEWSSDNKGAYEFWTESRELASAVADTMSLARGLFSKYRFDGDLPL